MRASKASPVKFDYKKESLFKALSLLLEGAGYKIRRENLKRGHGWKVVSGACRVQDNQMIFIDRRLSQDDQINFLVTRIREAKIPCLSEKIEGLSEETFLRMREILEGAPSAYAVSA